MGLAFAVIVGSLLFANHHKSRHRSLYIVSGLPEPVTVLLIVGLWIPGLRHDRAMLGRVHGATWVGVFVLGAGVALGGPVGFSAAWAALLDGWLGDA